MKKISIAFVLLLTVAMQIMANHDVVVNHNNRSVTILANLFTRKFTEIGDLTIPHIAKKDI